MPVITVIKPRRSLVPSSIPTAGNIELGELVLNIPDGKFYTKDGSGVVKEVGGAGAVTLQGVTDIGAVTTNNITLNGANLIFEGNVENAFETTLTVAEPTTDRTVTLPNRTGTLAIIETGRNIVIEGTSYNTTLTTTDPSANRTLTLPNQSGTLAMDGDALAYSIVFGG